IMTTCTMYYTLLTLTFSHSLFSFLYSYYGAHNYLHSFPTRRSSDLFSQISIHTPYRTNQKELEVFEERRLFTFDFMPIKLTNPRSEEHTSELQSRFDLVCRLLLEKKNKTRKNIALMSRTIRAKTSWS